MRRSARCTDMFHVVHTRCARDTFCSSCLLTWGVESGCDPAPCHEMLNVLRLFLTVKEHSAHFKLGFCDNVYQISYLLQMTLPTLSVFDLGAHCWCRSTLTLRTRIKDHQVTEMISLQMFWTWSALMGHYQLISTTGTRLNFTTKILLPDLSPACHC